MDTSLLNIKLIRERLSHIRISGIRLQRMVDLGKDQYIFDSDNFAIAEHHLRRSREAVLDIGRHIIAKMGLGLPQSKFLTVFCYSNPKLFFELR